MNTNNVVMWEIQSASGGTLFVFGSHTFVPISWMCKKQTDVSRSSTESEIVSLDMGLRLDLGNISYFQIRDKSHNKIDAMHDIDSVPSNVKSANQEALLYVFEDNEAVIKRL